MSLRIQQNLDFLSKLSDCNKSEARKLILEASENNIRALSEVVINILNGNLEINKEVYTALKSYSKCLRQIAKEKSVEKRKSCFLKIASVLPCIVTPLLSCLGQCLVKSVIESELGNG